MTKLFKLLMLFSIPTLISVNWLIGGRLVSQVPAVPLAGARVLFAAITLFFFSNINNCLSCKTTSEKILWWKQQFILSLSGRVLYSILSITALKFISPFEAILIAALLPIYIMIIEMLRGKKPAAKYIPLLCLSSCLFAVFAVYSLSPMNLNISRDAVWGFSLMISAMICFAIHLIYYKNKVIDKSSSNPLFAQFFIAALVIIPLDISGYGAFLELSTSGWIDFFLYSVVCNLLPFVLVHHSLKQFSASTVGAVSILSPIAAYLTTNIYSPNTLPVSFVLNGLMACLLIFMITKLDPGQKIIPILKRA